MTRTRAVLMVLALAAGLLGSTALPAGAGRDDDGRGGGPGADRRCAGFGPEGAAPPPASLSSASDHGRGRTVARRVQRCVRLNQIQVLGSHNSYRRATTPQILEVLRSLQPALAGELEYEHPPLAHQFSRQGIRQIELDVFADPEGGLYAGRRGLEIAGVPNDPPAELLRSGFKVLHIQDLDFNSSCTTFVACLRQVRTWSDRNAGHLPIAVLVELKDSPLPIDGFVVPRPIGPAELDALDAEIRSVFPEHRMITPDDVRGGAATLEAAVLGHGWPTLRESAGQVLFLMDNGGRYRDDYRAGRPSLEGRVLFTNAEPGSPDAAFVKANEPVGNVERIRRLVAEGYVVRTRSDVPTVQARNGDRTMLEAALASGAQWVSTDYPVPGSSPFSDYFATIPGGSPARCNPVNAGPSCVSGSLETLRSRPGRK